MRYFKRLWAESRGDEHSHWGPSWWYFEVDDGGNVVRQIEAYHNGIALKYGASRPHDEYGELATEFDLEDMAASKIDKAEFETRWIT